MFMAGSGVVGWVESSRPTTPLLGRGGPRRLDPPYLLIPRPSSRSDRQPLQFDPGHKLAGLETADLVLDAVVVDAIQIGEEPVQARPAVELIARAVVMHGRV